MTSVLARRFCVLGVLLALVAGCDDNGRSVGAGWVPPVQDEGKDVSGADGATDAPTGDVAADAGDDGGTQDGLVEDTPVSDVPIKDTPVSDVPIKDTPVSDVPVKDTPVVDVPVEDTSIEDTPVEDVPVEDVPVVDIPFDGGGGSTAAQIAAVRAAVDGPVSLPIAGGIVVDTKPAAGDDPAGFFLQAGATGPAVFVAIDPATYGLVVGHVLSLTVLEVSTAHGMRFVNTVFGLSKTGTATVGSLIQNVSDVGDLVSNLGGYESELTTATLVLTGNANLAGTDHVGFAADTDALWDTELIELRIPTSLMASLKLTAGCEVTVGPTGLWRYYTKAQLSAWTTSDITVHSCPAPTDTVEMLINELNANVSLGCDLVELRVIAGGNLLGFSLEQRQQTLVVFGDLDVEAGDHIVVHLDGSDALCNPGAAGQETLSKTHYGGLSHPTNYPDAWDWYSPVNGVIATDNVLVLYDPSGLIVDAACFTDDPLGTAAAETEAAAETVAAFGEWKQASGPAPPNWLDENFHAHAVVGLKNSGTDASGDALQRIDDLDTNTKSDWTQGPTTFGGANGGQ